MVQHWSRIILGCRKLKITILGCDAVFKRVFTLLKRNSPYLDPICRAGSTPPLLLLSRWKCTHHLRRRILPGRRTTLRIQCPYRDLVCQQEQDTILVVLQQYTPLHGSKMGRRSSPGLDLEWLSSRNRHHGHSRHTYLHNIHHQCTLLGC